MGGMRKENRIPSKIDELPSGIEGQVDVMLSDTSNNYQDVSDWLKEKGYEISKSSVGRYVIWSNMAAQRSLGAQSRIKALVNVARKDPDVDYTGAGLMLMMDGLISRLATAEDEFDHLPLDKVRRLIASLSRTKVYKDKTHQDMKGKADLAFKEMKGEIMKIIKSDLKLKIRLKRILARVKEPILHG